jgi:hypothetical protein
MAVDERRIALIESAATHRFASPLGTTVARLGLQSTRRF